MCMPLIFKVRNKKKILYLIMLIGISDVNFNEIQSIVSNSSFNVRFLERISTMLE